MPKKEKNLFNHFFKEDAKPVQDIINGGINEQPSNEVEFAKKEECPRLSSPKEIGEEEFSAQWQKLRSFFRNGNNLSGLPADLSPAILASFQSKTIVGTDFPVWVAGENASCLSLKEIVTTSLNEIGPGENDAPVLKRNAERILHIANNLLADKNPQLFQPAIDQILDQLEQQIKVSGDEAQVFKRNIKNLKKALPGFGTLLPYSINISFQILEAAMVATLEPVRKTFLQEIKKLKSNLKDLLRIDQEKDPDRKDPDMLQDSLSFVDSMVKFDELSSLLPGAGSERLGQERAQRITTVVRDLEEAETMLNRQGYLFIDELLNKNNKIDWGNLFGNAEVEIYQKGKGCDSVASTFNRHITTFSKIFAAKRIGELELENKYQPGIHDEYFKHFDWQSFTTNELNICPYFILIVDDIQLFDEEFSKLSTMLSNNIPVKVLALKRDNYVDHDQHKLEKKVSELHTKAELGALMLSHKNIYVAQSTSITPKYLFKGFKEGLSAFAPAFFYVLNIDEQTHKNPFVWTSATIEGRDFPGFTFKGLLGTPWGSRFEVKNNPQPTLPWPVHNLKIIDEEGNKKEIGLPFTFADQAVLNPAYHRFYLPVISSCWCDNLIPLTEYMESSTEDNIGKVPFIWMTDAANELQKVAVSWHIVLATQERLDFWKFLQENSGINNYHVIQAVEKAKAEMQEQHNHEIEQIKGVHAFEIQNIREEEAGKAIDNLTSALLDLDTTNVVTTSTPVPGPPPVSSPATESESLSPEDDAAREMEEEESLLSNDPYIDTALCTSCNECINMNSALFKYNADKMAYIADPRAGTFRELVEAAEVCPVGIIHPGSPLNPNEADLEDLIERAKKFN